ncbi:MAG: glycine betaine/L-proline ABC transporter ATP-binding protein [Dehalococcoidales bacterium]|nr:glycine betaine/L-proline ABC transporter ATP-binding protein [Dehalococcoidales bacterium]
MLEKNIKISCQNIWKIFGPTPESILDNIQDYEGATKQDFLEQTGHVIAVKNVSFDVYENEIFVVMGLSGSGKSTLVRCINRLIEPTRGSVLIDNDDIAQMDKDALRELRRHKLSVVFQYFGLLPHRSVKDNVGFGLEIRGEKGREKDEKINAAIEQVGLKGWEKNQIDELSGGMQQRVGLARALAIGSEILLMDEPFSALDPLIRRQMQDEFVNISSEVKKTVVFITHDLLEAITLGDRIAIMRDGEIVQIGTPQEIVSYPADEYVSDFVKDVPKGRVILAKHIMSQPDLIINREKNLNETIEEMKANENKITFVVDDRQRMMGLMTIEQAEESLAEGKTKVHEVINEEYPSASRNDTIEDCLYLDNTENLPVVVLGRNKRLLGMITRQTIINSMQSGNITNEDNTEQ